MKTFFKASIAVENSFVTQSFRFLIGVASIIDGFIAIITLGIVITNFRTEMSFRLAETRMKEELSKELE